MIVRIGSSLLGILAALLASKLAVAGVATPPKPKIALEKIFDLIQDYPPRALREYEEGAVTVNLDIGIDGRVVNCIVQDSSKSVDIDQASCRIMIRRARFFPEIDEKGTVVPSNYLYKIDWKLPPPPSSRDYALIYDYWGDPLNIKNEWVLREYKAPILLRGRFRGDSRYDVATTHATERNTYYRVIITQRGRVARCAIAGSSGSAERDGLICPYVLKYARYSPARDKSGKRVQVGWVERVEWDSTSARHY